MNSKGSRPPDYMPVFSPDTYIRRQRIHRSLALRKGMRQQHAFSLSTCIFFPRRHFASALSRQGRLLLWLIWSFYYSFKTKAKVGTTSTWTYPKKIYRRVHHGPKTYHSCDQTTLQTKWGRMTCEGTSDRPLSASVVLKKNRCRIFHNGVRWRKDSLKDLANCHLWEMNVEEGKSAKTRRARRPTRTWTWTLSLRDLGRARTLQSRDCTTVSMYGINSAR